MGERIVVGAHLFKSTFTPHWAPQHEAVRTVKQESGDVCSQHLRQPDSDLYISFLSCISTIPIKLVCVFVLN